MTKKGHFSGKEEDADFANRNERTESAENPKR